MSNNEKRLIKLAAESQGNTVEQVLSSRVTDTEVIIVVDNGIKGCPKYTLLIDELEQPKPAAKKANSQ